jgi:hypothetical protein
MPTVYISIGNSDDKLTQAQWSKFALAIAAEVASIGSLHGAWTSHPLNPYQNACWCVEFASDGEAEGAKAIAAEVGREYQQDSIAWAVAETEFI